VRVSATYLGLLRAVPVRSRTFDDQQKFGTKPKLAVFIVIVRLLIRHCKIRELPLQYIRNHRKQNAKSADENEHDCSKTTSGFDRCTRGVPSVANNDNTGAMVGSIHTRAAIVGAKRIEDHPGVDGI